MYAKYQTDALVLSSRSLGEADKIFTLYTRDFGLVRARASAVRREHSRMRYGLQNFSRTQAALVRGARGWRIVGSVSGRGMNGAERSAMRVFARIAALIERLVGGEERNEYLFAALAEAHALLREPTCPAQATVELICVARVLFGLGYLSNEALETALFTHTAYTGEHLAEAEVLKDKLLSSVNRALAETQL